MHIPQDSSKCVSKDIDIGETSKSNKVFKKKKIYIYMHVYIYYMIIYVYGSMDSSWREYLRDYVRINFNSRRIMKYRKILIICRGL